MFFVYIYIYKDYYKLTTIKRIMWPFSEQKKTISREKEEKKEPEPEKKPEKGSNYEFSEIDRERALEARRSASERRALIQEQQDRLKDLQAQKRALDLERQIKRLEEQLNGDDDETEEPEEPENADPLAIIAAGFLQGMNKPQAPIMAPQNNLITHAPEPLDFTDEEIKSIIDTIPKSQLAIAQKLPDSAIIKLIMQRLPYISDSSAKRGLEFLKKKDLVIKNGK